MGSLSTQVDREPILYRYKVNSVFIFLVKIYLANL